MKDFIIYVWLIGLITGMAVGGLLFVKCPKVIVSEDRCCVDNNLNNVCDGQENETTVVVHAQGSGNVVVVSGLSISESGNANTLTTSTSSNTQTTVRPSATTTTSTTTTTTLPAEEDSNSTLGAEETCDNAALSIYRVVYHDGEFSNVEVLMRNNGLFDIKRWLIKVYDEENGLALQNRFWKRLNASSTDELQFEFGDNELVNAGNDVVRVKVAAILGENVCDEISIFGDKLDTKNS
jgi:hypothetical protein